MSSRCRVLALLFFGLLSSSALQAAPFKGRVTFTNVSLAEVADASEFIIVGRLLRSGGDAEHVRLDPHPDVYEVRALPRCGTRPVKVGDQVEVWPFYLPWQLDDGVLETGGNRYAGRSAPRVGQERVLFLSNWKDRWFLEAKGGYALPADLPPELRFNAAQDCASPNNHGLGAFLEIVDRSCGRDRDCRVVDLRANCWDPPAVVSRKNAPDALAHFTRLAAESHGNCGAPMPATTAVCRQDTCKDAWEHPGALFTVAEATSMTRCLPTDGYGGLAVSFQAPDHHAAVEFLFDHTHHAPSDVDLGTSPGVTAQYRWTLTRYRAIKTGTLRLGPLAKDGTRTARFSVDVGGGETLAGEATVKPSTQRFFCGN